MKTHLALAVCMFLGCTNFLLGWGMNSLAWALGSSCAVASVILTRMGWPSPADATANLAQLTVRNTETLIKSLVPTAIYILQAVYSRPRYPWEISLYLVDVYGIEDRASARYLQYRALEEFRLIEMSEDGRYAITPLGRRFVGEGDG